MRKLATQPLFVLALLALPLAASSVSSTKPEEVGVSSERLKRINQMIQRRIDAGELPGAVTIVARKGRVVHLEAQGVMDLESKKPMTKDAMFRVASMTKPVTGLAIMMMLEEGKVRLTDPVSRFIPEFRGMKVAVALPSQGRGGVSVVLSAPAGGPPPPPPFYTIPAEREITVRDLLTHVSGLVSGPMSNSEMQKLNRGDGENLASFIPKLGSTPLEFQPGSRWQYSAQAGFDTLGRIVEIVSGMPLDKFFRQRIFAPLGMKDIYFWPPDETWPRVATAYRRIPQVQGLEKSPNPNFMSSKVYFMGSGGLIATAEDYLPFGVMLANGGQLNGKRLLSPKTVEMMRAVHVPDTLPGRQPGEGFGLSVRVVNDHAKRGTLLSTGSFGWSGYYGTHFFVDPVEQVVAVLMVQASIPELQRDFEDAVMQSIVE